jgi:putative hydrolase of the HAD superfamily
MIKNICFDVGNVLINFQPADFLAQKGYENNKIKTMVTDIFHSEEWRLLDNGDISFEEAYNIIAGKSTLSKEEIVSAFDMLPELLSPIEENQKLLPLLKEKGYKLFYISNFTVKYFDMILKRDPLFGYFDNGVISGNLRLSKPEKEIFLHAFNNFMILPEESLFIDDVFENIITARSLGMNTIHLQKGEILSEIFKIQKVL